MAHGLVVTTAGTASSWTPMMNSAPASPAATPGTYRHLCPVPGHAQKGMAGTFQVTRGS